MKWRRGTDLPFGTWDFPQAVVFREKVYIGGGRASSSREMQTVIVYDPQLDTWDTLPPYVYILFSLAVVNNQLVFVGGWDGKRTNKLGVWDEQSRRWTHPLPPMTTACNSSSVATHNNRWLVVIGGVGDGGTTLSRVEILDTESRQWYRAAPLPQPCSSASSVIISDMCYLLGGYTKGQLSQKVIRVRMDDLISQAVSQPAAPPTPSPWQTIPNTPLIGSTAIAINGALLAIGDRSTDIYHYHPLSRSWIKAGELPTARSSCTCTVLPSGEVFVAGGRGADKQVDITLISYSSVDIYPVQ